MHAALSRSTLLALPNNNLFLSSPHARLVTRGLQYYLVAIFEMFVALNSAVNFIIYTILNKAFRDVLIQQVFKRRAPQQAPQHAVIAHEIADIERADGEPIASVVATLTPIASTGATATPIASIGATLAPIASTGATATPIASVSAL